MYRAGRRGIPGDAIAVPGPVPSDHLLPLWAIRLPRPDLPRGDRPVTGQWVVVIRDIPANEYKLLLGPFRDEKRAVAAARRINGDFAARRAQNVMEAVVKWMQPGAEERDVREELIAELIEGGYGYFGPVTT